MSKAKVGGYGFNYELSRIRLATNTIRDSLSRIVEETPGPQTIYALIAKCAVQIGIILDAIANIEKIGKETKQGRTQQD